MWADFYLFSYVWAESFIYLFICVSSIASLIFIWVSSIASLIYLFIHLFIFMWAAWLHLFIYSFIYFHVSIFVDLFSHEHICLFIFIFLIFLSRLIYLFVFIWVNRIVSLICLFIYLFSYEHKVAKIVRFESPKIQRISLKRAEGGGAGGLSASLKDSRNYKNIAQMYGGGLSELGASF